MKVIINIAIFCISLNVYADWEISSENIYKSAISKLGSDQVEFEKNYIDELKKLTTIDLDARTEIKAASEYAVVYSSSAANLEINCASYKKLSDCLYGRYESYLYVIKSNDNKVKSIGHSFLLPRGYEDRFGQYGVEQEIIYFQGQNKYTGTQANF